MKQKIYIAALLAGMLALVGCGGGNSTGGQPPGGNPPDPAALNAAITAVLALDGSDDETTADITTAISTFEDADTAYDGDDPDNLAEAKRLVAALKEIVKDRDDAVTAGNTATSFLTVLNDLRTTTDSLETLSGGATATGSALKKATDAGKKTTAIKAHGSSSNVMAYAQMVLDAKSDLEDAIEAVEEDHGAAKTRLASLTSGSSDHALLDGAIKKADAAVKAAKALLQDSEGQQLGALELEVRKYEGKGKTPKEQAEAVAKSIHTAMIALDGEAAGTDVWTLPTTEDGLTGTSGTALNTQTKDKNAFATGNSNPDALTLTQIFGSEKNEAGDIKFSLNGVTTSLVNNVDDAGTADTDAIGFVTGEGTTTNNGISTRNAGTTADQHVTYLGIQGGLYCYDAACSAPGTTFGAGWHFVPSETDNRYERKSDGDYMQAQYVEWGMWITGTNTVNGYIGKGLGSAVLRTTVGTGAGEVSFTRGASSVTTDVRATYSGAAVGLSATQKGTGAAATHASGHFIADVELKAVFGAAVGDAKLNGEIDNFRDAAGNGGSHVNTAWSLDLVERTGWATPANGTFENDINGGWTAQGYATGTGTKYQPDGIFGRFNAEFSDGAAAGVYHAEKD